MNLVNFLVYLTLCVCVFAAPQHRNDEEIEDLLQLAESCDPTICTPPNCRCSTTLLDDAIPHEDTPQLVMLTFDDAVTALNYEYIEEALGGRRNPDNCPAAATFFVSHEYTDYSKVHALWAAGHEIALHSITHTPSTEYWKTASVDTFIAEFGDQRDTLAHFAAIDRDDIVGVRVPHLQLAGNNSFEAIRRFGGLYDCSWPTQHFIAPGMWPFTLDYTSTMDCTLGNCPTASIPGVWVAPMIDWIDTEGYKCAMVDTCPNMPEDDVDATFEWMKENFERIYHSNRAPFGVFLHSAWFLTRSSNYPAYKKFIAYMNSLPDVYLVSVSKAVEYTRDPRAVTGTSAVPPDNPPESEEEVVEEPQPQPQPEPQPQPQPQPDSAQEEPEQEENHSEEEIHEEEEHNVDEEENHAEEEHHVDEEEHHVDVEEHPIEGEEENVVVDPRRRVRRQVRPNSAFNECQAVHENTCVPKVCQLTKTSTGEERWMTSCVPCPAVYPWLGNPLGLREVVQPEENDEE